MVTVPKTLVSNTAPSTYGPPTLTSNKVPAAKTPGGSNQNAKSSIISIQNQLVSLSKLFQDPRLKSVIQLDTSTLGNIGSQIAPNAADGIWGNKTNAAMKTLSQVASIIASKNVGFDTNDLAALNTAISTKSSAAITALLEKLSNASTELAENIAKSPRPTIANELTDQEKFRAAQMSNVVIAMYGEIPVRFADILSTKNFEQFLDDNNLKQHADDVLKQVGKGLRIATLKNKQSNPTAVI